MNPMNGRAVREIVFKNGTSKVCCDFESMCIFNASHIDHDDDWVCVYRDGKEVERYNARYLLAIKWFIGTEPDDCPLRKHEVKGEITLTKLDSPDAMVERMQSYAKHEVKEGER